MCYIVIVNAVGEEVSCEVSGERALAVLTVQLRDATSLEDIKSIVSMISTILGSAS